jgi:glycosyltransferase involved in cell wall biosynthesis
VVVAAAAGGALEQIEHEKTGLLFPTNTPQALEVLLSRVIASPALRARISQHAVSFSRAALDYARLGPSLLSLYEHLMVAPSEHERLSGAQTVSSRGDGPGA